MQNHRAPPSPESTSSSRGALRNAGSTLLSSSKPRTVCKDARATSSIFCERRFDGVDGCPATGDAREAAILLRATSNAKPAAVMKAKDHPLYRAAIADYEGQLSGYLAESGQSELLHTKIRREHPNVDLAALDDPDRVLVKAGDVPRYQAVAMLYRESLKGDVHAEESVVKQHPWVVWPALENPDLLVCAEATDEDLLRMERRKAQRAAKAVHARERQEAEERPEVRERRRAETAVLTKASQSLDTERTRGATTPGELTARQPMRATPEVRQHETGVGHDVWNEHLRHMVRLDRLEDGTVACCVVFDPSHDMPKGSYSTSSRRHDKDILTLVQEWEANDPSAIQRMDLTRATSSPSAAGKLGRSLCGMPAMLDLTLRCSPTLAAAIFHPYVDTLACMPFLSKLHLEDCWLNEEVAVNAARSLSHLPRLKELICVNTFASPGCAVTLVSGLKYTPDLVSLRLSGSRDCDRVQELEDVKGILNALVHVRHLQDLDISRMPIGEEGFVIVCAALLAGSVPSLEVLDVTECRCGGAFSALADVMPAVQRLKTLRIGGNADHATRGLADGLRCVGAALSFVPHLLELDVHDNGLRAGAAALMDSLHHVPGLRVLDVSGNHIGDTGTRTLASKLAGLQCLERLSTMRNDIGDAGGLSLAEAVSDLPSMVGFFCGQNMMGDIGASAVTAAFLKLPRLREFSVDGGMRLDKGVCAGTRSDLLCRVLPHVGEHVRRITVASIPELPHPSLGTASVAALMAVMSFLPHLEFLQLEWQGLGVSELLAVAADVKNLTKLQILHISDKGSNPQEDMTDVKSTLRREVNPQCHVHISCGAPDNDACQRCVQETCPAGH